MNKALKILGIIFGVLLSVIVITVIVGILLFEWSWFRNVAVAAASDATGREVRIDGDMSGTVSFTPKIRIEKISVANTKWGAAPHLLEIGAIEFEIELWELLTGDVVLPSVEMANARLAMEKNEKGQDNWTLGPSLAGVAGEAVLPDDRTELPRIGRLLILESQITYTDPKQKTDISLALERVDGDIDAGKTTLKGRGKYDRQPLLISMRSGSYQALQESENPWPLNLSIKIGNTSFKSDGVAAKPLSFDGLDFTILLEGDDLAKLFPIIGIPLPPTAPYRLAGQLKRDGAVWQVAKLDGRVGESNLTGNVRVDTAPKINKIDATLVSEKLDYKDLGGLIGIDPDAPDKANKNPDRVIPDVPVNLTRLRAVDMKIDLTAKQVLAPNLPINDLRAVFNLDDGVLAINPVKLGIAGGDVAGRITLNGKFDVPTVDAGLTMKALRFKALLREFDMGDLTSGRFGGKFDLKGRGRSLADLLASANGQVIVAASGGTLNPLVVELIGLDIGQALAILVTDGKPVKIRCMLGKADVKQGALKIDGLFLDTEDSLIRATGGLNFRDETLDIRLQANPKDVSLLSANAPIAISGIFKDPDIAVDPLGTEDKGGLVEAIGKVLNPLAALVPLVDLGLGKDADCGSLQPADPAQPGAGGK